MIDEKEDASYNVDWRIPRPSLYTSSSGTNSSIATSNYEKNIRSVYSLELMPHGKLDDVIIDLPNGENWYNTGSSTSITSNSSSQSTSSGALLLTTNNLNNLRNDPVTIKSPDTQSIASSTHFTLINGITLSRKPLSECCWRNHQLHVLVISMTIIFFLGILGAVLYIEIRATELRHS